MEYPALKNVYTCYPGGKHKALTFSFDDGCVEDRRLVALFNQYGEVVGITNAKYSSSSNSEASIDNIGFATLF